MFGHAADPDVVGGIHHDHQMEVLPLPGFDQERDVLDHDGAGRGGGDHRRGALPHQGVDDAVQHGQALRITEDQGTEPGPVQPAFRGQDGGTEGLHHTGQPGRTRFHDLPGQRVGVDKHCSEVAQARGNHGLP